jgi:hypothetical protein
MCNKQELPRKTSIFGSLIERLLGKKTFQNVEVPTFEENEGEQSDATTLPPRNRLVLDADRRYRHKGVDGWKIQGYAFNGDILLTTDLYKHIDAKELRSLNPELCPDVEPKLGSFYRIRRSSGQFEKFQFQGVNPANKKIMMVKPEGHTISVSEEDLAKENWGWKSSARKAAI